MSDSKPGGPHPDKDAAEDGRAGPARPEIRRLVLGPFQANCYLVTCPETSETLVIDPGAEAGRILKAVEEVRAGEARGETERARVVGIVATHGHVDHVGAAEALREKTGAPVLIHREDATMLENPMMNLAALLPDDAGGGPRRIAADRRLEDGEHLTCGRMSFVVRHSPGHTRGGICLILEREPEEASVCFSGDTLFAGSVGRTDFPGGDWETLEQSIREVIYTLPDRTSVLPGHGPETSVGREKRTNPFVGA